MSSLHGVSAAALRRIARLLDVRELGASSCASRAMLAAAQPAWAPLLSKRFPHAAKPPPAPAAARACLRSQLALRRLARWSASHPRTRPPSGALLRLEDLRFFVHVADGDRTVWEGCPRAVAGSQLGGLDAIQLDLRAMWASCAAAWPKMRALLGSSEDIAPLRDAALGALTLTLVVERVGARDGARDGAGPSDR